METLAASTSEEESGIVAPRGFRPFFASPAVRVCCGIRPRSLYPRAGILPDLKFTGAQPTKASDLTQPPKTSLMSEYCPPICCAPPPSTSDVGLNLTTVTVNIPRCCLLPAAARKLHQSPTQTCSGKEAPSISNAMVVYLHALWPSPTTVAACYRWA